MTIEIGPIRLADPVILAPLSGITDLPFRRVVKQNGAALVVSEMIASQAMIRETRQSLRMAENAPEEYPMAIQLAGCEPEVMAEQAAEHRSKSLLKLKLGGSDDIARVRAVRDAVPEATIIVDANEAWTPVMYAEYGAELARLGVRLVEQPLPADSDHLLDGLGRSVPVCADESCHGVDTLGQVARRYDFINIKLDKTGGLTEALRLAAAAHQAGVGIMVGCMVGTSLGMAPAFFLAGRAQIVDLDGPLLLAEDRVPGIDYEESQMQPPPPELWG